MFSWYDEIQRIKAWIDKNVEGNISLAEISDYCGYSPHYLSKKFHELEGITLKEYMLVLKIQHCARQLLETDSRIIDIALNHGYSSQEAFT